MGVLTSPPQMNVDEFLAWATAQPEGERYELERGEVVAMSPEKADHTRVKIPCLVRPPAGLAGRRAERLRGVR